MNPKDYFASPTSSSQRNYEALKTFYSSDWTVRQTAKQFGFSDTYFKRIRADFLKKLQSGINPFFTDKKPGPKKGEMNFLTERIVALRKKNYSITDIKALLNAQSQQISIDTIDRILKNEGFAPLPKRTRMEKINAILPEKIDAPRSQALEIIKEEFTTEMGAGPLVFLPLLEKLEIISAIEKSGFPHTKELSAVNMVLSFLSLKLLGGLRWSHDTTWNLDRALGFFAGLNVLPKSTTLSTYSYRVSRKSNRALLLHLGKIFNSREEPDTEFNLDFKAIPHWGDDSVLEKNWCGSRGKAMKSVLAVIVEAVSSQQLSYTNSELKHSDQNNAVIEFVDFWKEGQGVPPKMLIFDSKFTSYQQLDKLNQSEDNIKFLTLRRRGKNLFKEVEKIPEESWQTVHLERAKGRSQRVRIYDGTCTLRHYKGEVRQIIMVDHGREKPVFMITNDFKCSAKDLIRKYARRWLVEQEIAEQVLFFQLNHPSSSIVVKVDFDLTLSLLAHNLYRVLAKDLIGFEHCTVETICRKFLANGARIVVTDNTVNVVFKKKTHLPILLDVPWLQNTTNLSWMGVNIKFSGGTVS